MKIITPEQIKTELKDYKVYGEIGIVVTHVIRIEEPTFLSEILDDADYFLSQDIDMEVNGLTQCDCVIRKDVEL